MNTPNHDIATIGARVNEADGTVTITANGIAVAVVNLRDHIGSNAIGVHMNAIAYVSRDDASSLESMRVWGSPSFDSTPIRRSVSPELADDLHAIVIQNCI